MTVIEAARALGKVVQQDERYKAYVDAKKKNDADEGLQQLIGNPHAIGEAFQITCDETLTWDQIYGTIADVLGVKLNAYHVSSEFLAAVSDYDYTGSLIGDKACSVVFDNSKLKKAVPEFSPKVHFEQGVKNTIDYVLSHPELQTEDKEFDDWCDRVIAALENAKKEIMQNG